MESIHKKISNSSKNSNLNNKLTCDSSILDKNFYIGSSLFNETKIFVSDKIDGLFDFDSFLKSKNNALDFPFNSDENNLIEIPTENEIFFAEIE